MHVIHDWLLRCAMGVRQVPDHRAGPARAALRGAGGALAPAWRAGGACGYAFPVWPAHSTYAFPVWPVHSTYAFPVWPVHSTCAFPEPARLTHACRRVQAALLDEAAAAAAAGPAKGAKPAAAGAGADKGKAKPTVRRPIAFETAPSRLFVLCSRALSGCCARAVSLCVRIRCTFVYAYPHSGGQEGRSCAGGRCGRGGGQPAPRGMRVRISRMGADSAYGNAYAQAPQPLALLARGGTGGGRLVVTVWQVCAPARRWTFSYGAVHFLCAFGGCLSSEARV